MVAFSPEAASPDFPVEHATSEKRRATPHATGRIVRGVNGVNMVKLQNVDARVNTRFHFGMLPKSRRVRMSRHPPHSPDATLPRPVRRAKIARVIHF